MENLGALILGIIDILVALGLLIWGVVAGIWYLIVIAVVLFVAPFIVMATNHYKIDTKNITLIDEIENDYRRRQGNILLGTVKYIKSETFETKIRHKVNDKGLKRRLAISHRKVSKLFDGLLASLGGESELLERDFTNRLQEIEKEIEQEREAQGNVEEQLKINSKWTWGK